MTQPPLSRHIQLLEHEMGIQLLQRTSRSVRLTPAGSAFLQEAVRILALVESSAASAQRIARGEAGQLRLGFTAGSSYSFLPKLLTSATATLADIHIALVEMVTRQQIEALQSNTIDIGLQRVTAPPEDLDVLLVARERMMIALPKGHRLAKGRLPSLVDLRGEPVITFSPRDGYYFHQLVDGLFTAASVAPRYVQQISQIHSILALVSSGMGLAIVPESAKRLHFAGSVLRDLKMPPVYAELHMVWRKDNENPALPVFLHLVRQHFALGGKSLHL